MKIKFFTLALLALFLGSNDASAQGLKDAYKKEFDDW